MSEGSSGRGPERPSADAADADRSSWFSEALGQGWVEVEPGIFRQIADDPAPPQRPAAMPEAQSLEETLREALPADSAERDTASAVEPEL